MTTLPSSAPSVRGGDASAPILSVEAWSSATKSANTVWST